MLSLVAALTLGVTPAQAAEVMVGAGARGTVNGPGRLDGPRVLGAVDLGWFSLEGNLMVNPLTARYSELDRTLVLIAGNVSDTAFQQPVQNDIFAAQALVSADVLPETAQDWGKMGEADFSGSPRLYVGVEGRLVQTGFLRFDETTEDGVRLDLTDRQMTMGPVFGAGMDAWWGHRVGLRVSWCARTAIEDAPQYDPDVPVDDRELTIRNSYNLDLVVKL
ncbi:MAG: hypothetical protein H6739_10530 [Alphaproteobacteria bacterium]|nr:hypothetical protein [Alphaproteobacteria bacterium]